MFTYLTVQQENSLTDALLAAGLNTADARDALLMGIDPGFVAELPDRQSTLAQLQSDINTMNSVSHLENGQVPLRIWLENGVRRLQRSGRPERGLFQEMLDLVNAKSEQTGRDSPGAKCDEVSLQLPIFAVPHRRNINFTGREDLLRQLERQLEVENRAAVTQAIAGLGGVGKTQLALEYSYQHEADYELLYWLKADEAATLGADLVALAQRLGLAAAEISNQEEVIDRQLAWLEGTEKRWLLVFDNVDTLQPQALRRYLPQKGNGHVLITSRNPAWRGIARVLQVNLFTTEEAIEFLQERTGQEDRGGAGELVKTLGYLPLALEHAAAYVEVTHSTYAEYQGYFEKQRGELWADIEAPDAYHATITTTWEVAFQQIKEGEAAVQLLDLCCFLAPDDIPISLLRGAVAGGLELPGGLRLALENPLQLDRAIAALQRYSLITRQDDALAVHRLVQAVARDRMGPERAEKWAALAVGLLLAAFPGDYDAYYGWQEGARLLPHLGEAAQLGDRYGSDLLQVALLCNQTGYYLQAILGDYAGALPYHERALATYEAQLGPDHPHTASSLIHLGLLLKDMGAYEEAQPYLERALAIREAQLGPDHLDTAQSLNDMGSLLQDMGAYKEAQPYLERALATYEAQLGPDHPHTATSLNNLGLLLQAMGAYEEALPYLERALAIWEAQLGPDHPITATSLNNLGMLLQDMGAYEEALPYLERALAIREAQLGPDHPHTASSLNNLGTLLLAMGAYEEALPYLERALAIWEAQLGPDHPHSKIARDNLKGLDGTLSE